MTTRTRLFGVLRGFTRRTRMLTTRVGGFNLQLFQRHLDGRRCLYTL